MGGGGYGGSNRNFWRSDRGRGRRADPNGGECSNRRRYREDNGRHRARRLGFCAERIDLSIEPRRARFAAKSKRGLNRVPRRSTARRFGSGLGRGHARRRNSGARYRANEPRRAAYNLGAQRRIKTMQPITLKLK